MKTKQKTGKHQDNKLSVDMLPANNPDPKKPLTVDDLVRLKKTTIRLTWGELWYLMEAAASRLTAESERHDEFFLGADRVGRWHVILGKLGAAQRRMVKAARRDAKRRGGQ